MHTEAHDHPYRMSPKSGMLGFEAVSLARITKSAFDFPKEPLQPLLSPPILSTPTNIEKCLEPLSICSWPSILQRQASSGGFRRAGGETGSRSELPGSFITPYPVASEMVLRARILLVNSRSRKNLLHFIRQAAPELT